MVARGELADISDVAFAVTQTATRAYSNLHLVIIFANDLTVAPTPKDRFNEKDLRCPRIGDSE